MASDNDFKFIMETILGQREDSPLYKSLKRDGFDDVIGIATLTEGCIENLKYKDDSSGNIIIVELDQDCRALVRCFKVFVRMKIDEGKPIHQDWQNLTIKADFQAFSIQTIGFTQATTYTVSNLIDNGVVKLHKDGRINDDEPPGLGCCASTLVDNCVTDIDNDNGIDVLLVDDEDSPGLATSLSTSIVIDLDDEAEFEFEATLADDDGIDEVPSEPPGHSFRVPSSVDNGNDVLHVDDDPPGLSSIPEESIDIETWSEPPGLGSIPDESIVIETWSEPPGRSFRVSTLDDSIGFFTSDLLDGENFVKKFKCLLVEAEFEEHFEEDGIFENTSKPPELGSATVVIGIHGDDGDDATWSNDPGLGSIPDESIVIKTWSEPADGLGLIPSEPCLSTSIDDGMIPNEPPELGPRLSTSIVIDLDNDDGIDEIPSEPPGLGSRLSTLIGNGVIDLGDNDGINVIPSEPPEFGSRLSTSIVIDLDKEDRIDETPNEPPGLCSRLSASIGNGGIDLDDDDGIYVIPSEPPGLGSCVPIPSEPSRLDSRLTFSVDDSYVLAVSGLDDNHGIHVVTDELIPIESSRLGSRPSSVDGVLFEQVHRTTPGSTDDLIKQLTTDIDDLIPSNLEATMDPLDGENLPQSSAIIKSVQDDAEDASNQVSIPSKASCLSTSVDDSHVLAFFGHDHDDSIPSEPPDGLGSRLLTLTDDRFSDDVGITSAHPLSSTNDLGAFHDKAIGTTPGEMSRLHEYNAFHDKDIGTTPGEQIKKISPSLLFWQGDTSDLLKDDTTLFGSSGSDKFPTRE
jgi:hypothetical protein